MLGNLNLQAFWPSVGPRGGWIEDGVSEGALPTEPAGEAAVNQEGSAPTSCHAQPRAVVFR